MLHATAIQLPTGHGQPRNDGRRAPGTLSNIGPVGTGKAAVDLPLPVS